MKLSKRLTQIENLVTAEYSHIWDTCCDHGLLGEALLSNKKAPNIHLVDIVPELISNLDEKFSRLFPNPCNQTAWYTYCLDISQLPLTNFQGKQLVIIAGIGGDLMIESVRKLMSNNPTLDIDFLLCPVHHLYALRQTLIDLKMGLKKEVLVKDNQRFYEVLLLSANKKNQFDLVSPVGKYIWQGKTRKEKEEAKEYRDKTLQHYQRMQRGKNSLELEYIVQTYQGIKISPCK